MSDIKIIEKIVAPNCCWASLELEGVKGETEVCAYKFVFDRAYPYFWVWVPCSIPELAGVALTLDDIKRAAVYEENTEGSTLEGGIETERRIIRFDIHEDGVLPCPAGMSICIAVGSRKSFYLLSNLGFYPGSLKVLVSAQEDSVCPFATSNNWV